VELEDEVKEKTDQQVAFEAMLKCVTIRLRALSRTLRRQPEMFEIDEMVDLQAKIDEAQNECIELSHALSVAHGVWLAKHHPEIKQHDSTGWIEREQAVQEYIKEHEAKSDLPAVLSAIDTTP
jgi:hypothetical protein